MSPIHVGHGLRHLVPVEFESRLLGARIYTKKAQGWSESARELGIFFDLSRVEWVDLGAVVQLVLLVEGAVKNGIHVSVALPLPLARKSEERWMHVNPAFAAPVMRRIEYRAAAKDFLHYIRFEQALRPAHLEKSINLIRVIDDYDSSAISIKEDDEVIFPEENVSETPNAHLERAELYKFCFPLTWLSRQKADNYDQIAKFLARVIGETKRGLESLDASTIANVILYELIENVIQHAEGTSWGLVAAWARPSHIPPNPLQCLPSERPYIDWINQKKSSIIEVVVGDSGKGIPAALQDHFIQEAVLNKPIVKPDMDKNANIMIWAFDRWSSSKDRSTLRGTRGLYRVDRVVKKYQGLITIRSENQLTGWDHGGSAYDEIISNKERLSRIPGTILRLRIPPFHESLPRRSTVGEKRGEVRFEVIDIGPINGDGLEPDKKNSLKQLLGNAQTDQPLCVIAVVNGGTEQREAVEEVLRQAAELRHPGALVIYGLPGGWELVANIVDSLNSEHEQQYRQVETHTQQHFQIWDPVLVVDTLGHTAWVGADRLQRKILDLLLEKGALTKSEVEEELHDSSERSYVLRHLRNDTNLAVIHNDGSVEIQFTISDISREFCNYVISILNNYVRNSGSGILSNEIFRAPSLHIVRKWLDVGQILSTTCGPDLVMLALSVRLKEHECWSQMNPANFILTDSTSHLSNIRSLQKFLGITRREIIPGETGVPVPAGVRIIDQGHQVIIHCDIIASNETVKRCFRQVLRDDATPVAITCIFDAREKREKVIEMWDIRAPVISLTEVDIMANNESPTRNINPITRQPEEKLTKIVAQSRIDKDALFPLIKKNNALHFSHIGRPIGRHFTFYLDVVRLLDETIIYDAFDSEITEWIGHDSTYEAAEPSESIELWYPEPEPRPSAPARRFAEAIHSRRKDIYRIRPIRREPAYGQWFFAGAQESSVKAPNVVIVDWGALTGSTVVQMIRLAADAGANRILACVFLSQLESDEEAFLRSLDGLRVFYIPRQLADNDAPLLPGFDELSESGTLPSRSEKHVQVLVDFLSRFPIASYNPNECPVCQQLARLSQEVYPTELLKEFAKRQKNERLRLRTREEVIESGPKDFDYRELSGEPAISMAYFREELVTALGSTAMRQSVYERIETMSKKIDDTVPSEDILSLLHFLSIETQWLRRPPLYFKSLRDKISEIALKVARNRRVPLSDRLNAIIVLRTSSKLLFANHFADVFDSAIGSEKLIEQILYDAFTYIVRPYHQSISVFDPLIRGFRQIESKLSNNEVKVPDSILETVSRLKVRAEAEYAKAKVRSLSPAQAWSKLRKEFGPEYRVHDPIPQSFMFMRPGFETEVIETLITESEKDPRVSVQLDPSVLPWLRSLERNWGRCRRFLDYTVLPLLAHVKPILLSEDSRRALGSETVEQLTELIDSLVLHKTPLAESTFSNLISRITANPDEILIRKNWESFKAGV